MTHIAEDVKSIAERLKEIQKEEELARNTPGSEHGVDTRTPPVPTAEPGHYPGSCYS